MGLFDEHVKGIDLHSHFGDIETKIKEVRNNDNQLDYMFAVPQKLASLLAVKGDVGIQLKQAYDSQNREKLKEIAEDVIPVIIEKVHKEAFNVQIRKREERVTAQRGS